MSRGKLILIPTPIAEGLPLEPVARELLADRGLCPEVLLLVEELKVARRMWSRFGLEREAFEKFIEYNEHTRAQKLPEIIRELKNGKDVFLLSDCGLPAFCDPGQELVEKCHVEGIQVTCTPFPNSVALAVALSGFVSDQFYFAGFISNKSPERERELKKICQRREMTVVMDTPYRFNKLLEELAQTAPEREAFLGINLNAIDGSEKCIRGGLAKLNEVFEKQKCEFILILGPMG